jgi:transcriptional regulator with PAS, ATPase and Fis domain
MGADGVTSAAPSTARRRDGAVKPAVLDHALAERAARSDCTILITGETGVGKGQLARWLHEHSRRADKPFIPMNCAAIPETIIDSQLFGHARGAFSGATHEHSGLVRAADTGTLLLDEVSELPLSAQGRLLRLLQDNEVQPVGYPRPVEVNVRVIAATNLELHKAVEERHFREDLLFRLDVIRLTVPPLRERPLELDILRDQFNREFAATYQQEPLEFNEPALRLMQRFAWPGNVRQLRTLLERLHVLCPGEVITPKTLIQIGQIGDLTRDADDIESLAEIRRDHVQKIVAEAGGSIAKAADMFGVHRSTVYRWLREQEA